MYEFNKRLARESRGGCTLSQTSAAPKSRRVRCVCGTERATARDSVCLHIRRRAVRLDSLTVPQSQWYPSARIVGGAEASDGYAAHMAALVVGRAFRGLVCGGSIVTAGRILTAAHCIEPMVDWEGDLISSFEAVVGSNQWNSDDIVVKFSHYANHPGWDWIDIKNDIGVLFLTEDLTFTERVQAVPLSFEWVGGGEESFVTGWGMTNWGIPDNLQLLDVSTVDPQVCIDKLQVAPFAPPMDPELEICTFHSYGHGMCNGDSGSALVSRNTGQQIGIVSWGFPCARGMPDIFVRISAYQDFITKHI
ncbi:chymotrypsin-2-like [Battus philenor]|uniref:chymotrypsin-2-like n=1 Tax=Battus philenor TaxID=42288 RepID=UPI0035CF7A38